MRDREARMYLLIDIGQEKKRETTHLSEALHKERKRQCAQQARLTDLERWHCVEGSGRGLNCSN